MEKHKRNTIIITCTLVAVGISTGGFLGYLLGERYNPALIPDANTDIVKKDDLKSIYNRYERYIEDKNPSNVDFSVIKDFTASDLVNIGIYQLKTSDKYLHISKGTSTTKGTISITQDINTIAIKEKDKYFKERIAYSSMVSLATRFYNFDILTENSNVFATETNVFSGKASTAVDATYTEEFKKYSDEEFKSIYGISNKEPFVYTICNDALSNKCTIDGINYVTNINKTDEGYKIVLALDPSKSTVDYRKEMLSTTDMDKENGKPVEPRFTNVALTFYLDPYLNIKSYEAKESYWVKKIGWNSMIGTCKYRIFTNEDFIKIPKIEEKIIYKDIWSME